MFKEAYTFDDVALIPQFNNISSRTEPSLESWLTKNQKIGMPIIASNMDTVINDSLVDVLLESGSIPIFHRFCSLEKQKQWLKKYPQKTFISCGINRIEETKELLDLGALGVCIDVAHGHSLKMFDLIEELKKSHPKQEIIAGNVCTPIAYQDLANAGADAIKVGIGPGAACTTRMITGFGIPQFSAIYECAKIAQKLRVPLIADGGIRCGRDMILALAAGASSVMIGKLFALCKESAAEKKVVDDKMYAKYRGQASVDFQTDFYGGLKAKTVAEGVDFWAPVEKTAKQLIDQFLGGLRSGMTYGGARNIKEFQRKAEFVRVTSNYLTESNPRKTTSSGEKDAFSKSLSPLLSKTN